jgi:uncharacterized protein YdhG (YjbR/CyaY superfamily)
MKNTRTGARRGDSNAKVGPSTVEEYLAGVPEPAVTALKKLRETIRSVVPREATEVISYRMPAFRHNGVLVWYAAFSNHVSLFPGAAVLAAFEDDLAGFKTSKGTLQFPTGKPLPIALIKRIVKARAEKLRRRNAAADP